MMRKNVIIALIISVIFMVPVDTNAASSYKTVGDMKAALADLKKEKQESEAEQKKTQNEIKANQNNVKSANDKIQSASDKISALNNEIASNEEKIKNLKNETMELLIVYQKLTNDNAYVKYVTGATSMTELIMRIDAIKQISDYNNKKINEMEQLVVSNTKMQKELANYQVELDKQITDYEARIASLGNDLRTLLDEYEDYDSQIRGLQENINYYVNLGCKDNQLISSCSVSYDTPGWIRPISSGIITSAWGYRFHPTQKRWKLHNGIDIGVAEGTKVYSSANGRVSKITRRASCGGNMVYVTVNVLGKEYTVTYMHLLSISVELNQIVNTNTVIGISGGGSTRSYDRCTTGAHLHYGVSTGHYPDKISYSKYVANSINPPNFPPKGSRFYTR